MQEWVLVFLISCDLFTAHDVSDADEQKKCFDKRRMVEYISLTFGLIDLKLIQGGRKFTASIFIFISV